MGDSNSFHDIEARRNKFQSFEHAAADIVLGAAFNFAGTRIILCSADHKIRVYNIDQNDEYFLVDQWRGHDAEVLDASIALLLPWKCIAKMITIRRSNGFHPAWVKSLPPSAVTISSNCGEKTHHKLSKVDDASGAFSRSRRSTMSPMFPLAPSQSDMIFSCP